MWNLYLEYERDLKLKEPFQLAAAGIGLGPVSEEQFVKLAAAMVPVVSGTAAHKVKCIGPSSGDLL
jgi:hypothetical protein